MRLNFAMLSNPTQKLMGHEGTGGTTNSQAVLTRPTLPADAWDTVGQVPGQIVRWEDDNWHLSHLSHLEQNEVGQAEHSVHRVVPRVPPVPPFSEPSAAAGSFDHEAFDERAAIMEHDGGMSRAEAEAAAVICGEASAPEALDPDRHCWPHTEAMNTAEIDTFTARLHLFTRHGLDITEAEGLADGLVVRDRQADDRRLCLECPHMRRAGGLWRCGQWQRAGLAVADVPGDVAKLPQRCNAFMKTM